MRVLPTPGLAGQMPPGFSIVDPCSRGSACTAAVPRLWRKAPEFPRATLEGRMETWEPLHAEDLG